MITITHNGDDITEFVALNGFRIDDNRNSVRDTLRFIVEKQPGGFTPQLNAEIIVTHGGTRIFGGSILSTEVSMEHPPVVVYEVECVDFSYQMDRKLVTERFTDQTFADIITALVASYAPTFTANSVVANSVVANSVVVSISFNRLTLSECLDKLAKLNNFYWYVDYYKDVHFFARNDESAPFNLTADSNNYIFSSLRVRSDLSQLRNIVQVYGSEVPSISPRTTTHTGDGSKTEFPTSFKFSNKPVVTVGGVEMTVAVDNLNTTGFDCYWSYQEKYVRFDAGSIPADEAVIEITGTPLVPTIVTVPDNDSIAEYGEFEFALTERSLSSQDELRSRGIAQLEAYAAALTEAEFDTYTPGLRAGQTINITHALLGVDADYVVQSVNFAPYPNGASLAGVWSVKLASTASMSLVDALRSLLKPEELEDDELEVLLAFFQFRDSGVGTDAVDTPETTERPYLLADENGDVLEGYAPFICNYAVLEDAA